MRPLFTELSEAAFNALPIPPLHIGTHPQNGVRLYRDAEDYFLMVNPRFDDSRPACTGVIIDNDIGGFMETEAVKPDRNVFYPGAAGPLALNLPATCNEQNEWVYYVAQNQIASFDVFDFTPVRQARMEAGHAA